LSSIVWHHPHPFREKVLTSVAVLLVVLVNVCVLAIVQVVLSFFKYRSRTPVDVELPSTYNLNIGKVNGRSASPDPPPVEHWTVFIVQSHGGAGSICHGGHSQSSTGPTPVAAIDARDWSCAFSNLDVDTHAALLARALKFATACLAGVTVTMTAILARALNCDVACRDGISVAVAELDARDDSFASGVLS
jgi:hypothetical protein